MKKHQPRQRSNQKQQRPRRFAVIHERDGSSNRYELMADLETARTKLAGDPKAFKLFELLHNGTTGQTKD